MPSESCLFCKIISGAIPAHKVVETDDLIVINDIHPKAPKHYLIIPKKHVPTIMSVDAGMMASVLHCIQVLGKQCEHESFRLVVNTGEHSGQSIFHVHFHMLAGKSMTDL